MTTFQLRKETFKKPVNVSPFLAKIQFFEGIFEKKSGWPKSFSRCGPMASVRGRAAERFGRKSRGTA